MGDVSVCVGVCVFKILTKYTRLSSKQWTLARATRQCERLLGLYQTPELSLPALMVTGRR